LMIVCTRFAQTLFQVVASAIVLFIVLFIPLLGVGALTVSRTDAKGRTK
jgi:hypothetical protein